MRRKVFDGSVARLLDPPFLVITVPAVPRPAGLRQTDEDPSLSASLETIAWVNCDSLSPS